MRSLPSESKGAGMIEVLVSLLILAVGLLGVLSLQANGLNSNKRAEFVTEAQILAEDMASRILTFGSTVSNGNGGPDGSNASGNINYAMSVTKTTTDPGSVALCSNCAPDATKVFDKSQWEKALFDSSLPLAKGTVTWASPVYKIQVMWDQERTGTAPSSCNATVNCFEMEIRL